MATEKDPQATRDVFLRNSGDGPRYVHAEGGAVMIGAGDTSEKLTIRECELADLPEGLAEHDGAADEAVDQDTQVADIPADLADPDSRDGIVTRAKLDETVAAEGVEGVKADDSKAEVLAKIVAHRAAQQN